MGSCSNRYGPKNVTNGALATISANFGNSFGDGRPAMTICNCPLDPRASELRISKLLRHLSMPNQPIFQGGPLGLVGSCIRAKEWSGNRTLFSRILIGLFRLRG